MSRYMRNQLLRDTDWASMAQSLEVRVPFLDAPLLKTMAPWFAAYPAIAKPQFAVAVAPALPGTFINKPKTGFTVPMRDWLMSDQGGQQERGIRGWARLVYKRHAGQC